MIRKENINEAVAKKFIPACREVTSIEKLQKMNNAYRKAWATGSIPLDVEKIIKRDKIRMDLDKIMSTYKSSGVAFIDDIFDHQALSHKGIGKILGVEPIANSSELDIRNIIISEVAPTVAPVKQRLSRTILADNFLINNNNGFMPLSGVREKLVSDVRKSVILVAHIYANGYSGIYGNYDNYAHQFDIGISNIDDLRNEKLEELLFEIIYDITGIVYLNHKEFYSVLTKYIRLTNMMILRKLYSEMWAMIGFMLLPNEIKHS